MTLIEEVKEIKQKILERECTCRTCAHYDPYIFKKGGICYEHETETMSNLTCCDHEYNINLD